MIRKLVNAFSNSDNLLAQHPVRSMQFEMKRILSTAAASCEGAVRVFCMVLVLVGVSASVALGEGVDGRVGDLGLDDDNSGLVAAGWRGRNDGADGRGDGRGRSAESRLNGKLVSSAAVGVAPVASCVRRDCGHLREDAVAC